MAVDLTSASLGFVDFFSSNRLNLVSFVEKGTELLSGESRGQIRSRKPQDVIYNFFNWNSLRAKGLLWRFAVVQAKGDKEM